MTFEEWYAQNKDKIWDFRCKREHSTPDEQQKAVAEIVWNLMRPDVSYHFDHTSTRGQITLTGGLQKGESPDIMGEQDEIGVDLDLDECPRCGSFDILWGKRYTNPNQIELKCETCGTKWTRNED